MEADEIGLAQELLLGDELGRKLALHGIGGALEIVVDDPHAEASSAPGHCASDAAQSENPQRAMVDVAADQTVDGPASPLAGVDEIGALDKAPGRSEEQGEGEVG